MAAEVRLSDGTTIKTDANTRSDQVIQQLGRHTTTNFQPILDQQGRTYFVNPTQVAFIRDV